MIGFQENRANTLGRRDGKLTGKVAEPILGREAKLATLIELRGALDLDADERSRRRRRQRSRHDPAAGLGVAYHAKPAVARRRPRASTMATSPRCFMCRAIGATSS